MGYIIDREHEFIKKKNLVDEFIEFEENGDKNIRLEISNETGGNEYQINLLYEDNIVDYLCVLIDTPLAIKKRKIEMLVNDTIGGLGGYLSSKRKRKGGKNSRLYGFNVRYGFNVNSILKTGKIESASILIKRLILNCKGEFDDAVKKAFALGNTDEIKAYLKEMLGRDKNE